VLPRELETTKSKWLSPTVLGLFAAAIALVGNVIVAAYNNRASQALERSKEQSNLILHAISTGNTDVACRNLVFFVSLGLLDDPKGTIVKCTTSTSPAPVLPSPQSRNIAEVRFTIDLVKDLGSVKVTYDVNLPSGGPSRIAAFKILIDGVDLIDSFTPGQTKYSGTRTHTLSHPDKNVLVTYVLFTTDGWYSDGSDTLYGDKTHDEVHFLK
jgi:hypothetical protein